MRLAARASRWKRAFCSSLVARIRAARLEVGADGGLVVLAACLGGGCTSTSLDLARRDFFGGRVGQAAELLDHTILVDTPDTDSMEEQVHKKILVPLVEHSDVLICVVDE